MIHDFRFKSLFFSAALLLVYPAVSAQYYNTGQDPASLKWLQIKTSRFNIIYPQNYGSAGTEFAMALEKAYSDLSALYPEKKFRIPVIIHNYTTQSNGYVAWAPKRMEIYPTPDQNTIPLDHSRQLLVIVIAGVAVSFLKGRVGMITPIIAGVIGLTLLLLLKAKIDNDVLRQGEGVLRVEYGIGFWLVLLLFLGAIGLNAFLFRQTNTGISLKGDTYGQHT